ncbi:NAD(P)H-dependent oxidoreductase [Mucilaginibacter sp. JRF]|uniref:NADPH-dependent FMN reductase n=1 Tax=Mucilaginibacter sp. JRF TaxID=2780088 RepID=UPI00187F2164|nr:NAD(P)H-dependent oxidoreductase [Mucilaginibacter sp. JRF]MBE9586826.1 NAD(P)H-dependent oxidoreductase [Mucilaginibacter sp. JRF]
MYNLKIITSTVRPGRKGPIVANWIKEVANKTGNFNAEVLDLGEINLPLMNEAVHPIMQQYEHEHTKQWSAKITEADAFIFVTAEYDYSYPAPLKNALEYLVHEWAYKPAGIVSYSLGQFAGVRAVSNLKADLLNLRTISLSEGVNIASLNQYIDENGIFSPNEQLHHVADVMLTQLVRWTKGLAAIKADQV